MISSVLALGMPGTTELIVIAVVALLIFGKRLPDVARSVGRSIVEFKKGIREAKDDIDSPPTNSGARSQPQLGKADAALLPTTPSTDEASNKTREADRQGVSADGSNGAA